MLTRQTIELHEAVAEKRGFLLGLKQSREEIRKKAIEMGMEKAMTQVAKNMLLAGLPLDLTAQATDIQMERLVELSAQLNALESASMRAQEQSM